MFKTIVMGLIIFGILGSCAIRTPLNSQEPALKRPLPAGKSDAFWHLLTPEKIELKLGRLNGPMKKTVPLEEVTQFRLKSGQWQIKGFTLNGESFESMNSSQQFLFKLAGQKNVYAGTIIVECPKVGEGHFDKLKEMKFFNRFYFKSRTAFCEMVVGSDLASIKKAAQELERPIPVPVVIGF